jgi:DNA helicase-2/ATP-dependent DNA helicase PcrA
MLNSHQLDAVIADEPRILMIAGAGSGKTHTLVERLARLLTAGVMPSEILALTFTRAAAEEMRERLEVRLPGRRPSFWRDIQVSTFHAWAARTLRTYADRVGLVPHFSIYDEMDQEDLILYAAQEVGLAPGPGQKKRAGQLTSTRRLWQEEGVRKRYYGLLREAHAVDYDGLERLLLALLRQEDVAESIRARRLHVLVDEAQDTSEGQQAIIDALNPRNLFVVGDSAQSIYSFRGAHVAGFVGLGARAEWRTIELPTNYRSLPAIVDAASRVAGAMATPGLRQAAAREGGDAGTVGELVGPDEGPLLADILERARAGAGWGDMAVLSPTWAPLEDLIPHLDRCEIPYVLARKALAIWDTEPARWLVHCLRVAVNPHDHAALWGALNAFTPRISLGDWARLRGAAGRAGVSVLDALCAGNVAPAIADSIRAVPAEGWPPEADALVERLREELRLLHLDTKREELDAAAAAVHVWIDTRRAAGAPAGVQDLLDWYSGRHVTEAADQAAQGDRVLLGTIHSAKGLEWGDVWILGCQEGALPRHPDAAGEPIEEQRRLFYVALTRGRDRVRFCRGEDARASRFVGEALSAIR